MALVAGNMPLGWTGDWLVVHVPGFVRMLRADEEGVWFEFRIADGLWAKARDKYNPPNADETKAFYAGAGEVLYIRRAPAGTPPADRETEVGTVGDHTYHRWVPHASQKVGFPRMDPNQGGYGYVGPDGVLDPSGGV